MIFSNHFIVLIFLKSQFYFLLIIDCSFNKKFVLDIIYRKAQYGLPWTLRHYKSLNNLLDIIYRNSYFFYNRELYVLQTSRYINHHIMVKIIYYCSTTNIIFVTTNRKSPKMHSFNMMVTYLYVYLQDFNFIESSIYPLSC